MTITEYCGVHTPESSPHGSPYSTTGDSVHRQGVGRASTSSSSQMSQSQSLGGHQQQQSTANLVYAPQTQNHQSLKTELDPSRNLPTPEMSPVEANERDTTFMNGVRYFPGVIRGTGQAMYHDSPVNPVSQLISRFSDGSTFLRNVCPPFRTREPSPPNVQSQQMEQVPSNSYELIRVSDPNNDHWSCPGPEYEKLCNYSYDKNELRESGSLPEHHFNHEQMNQHIVYGEMYRIPDQYQMAVHHQRDMIDHDQGHQVHESVQNETYPNDHIQTTYASNSVQNESNYRSATVICENNTGSAELMAALAETREIIS